MEAEVIKVQAHDTLVVFPVEATSLPGRLSGDLPRSHHAHLKRSGIHDFPLLVRRSDNPGKVVMSDEVLEAGEHRHIDNAPQAPPIISRLTEDIADGRLRDDHARETCVPGPKPLFLERLVVVLREDNFNRADVRSLDPGLPED